MSLKRYDFAWELMDESPTGKFVKLEDIIKLLKEHEANSDGLEGGDYAICACQYWSLKAEPYVDHIEQLIKGEQK